MHGFLVLEDNESEASWHLTFMVVNNIAVCDFAEFAEIISEVGFVHSYMKSANKNLSSFLWAKLGLRFFRMHVFFDIE